MSKEKLASLYKKYDLCKDDVYTHKHYIIITRQGIDKIQACEKINIDYQVVKCEKDYAVVKATAKVGDYTVQTFGSALYGQKENINGKWIDTGTTQSWYIMEMAEKRAMSRAVLKLTGFYELGVFSEEESTEFKKEPEKKSTPKEKMTNDLIKVVVDWAIANNIGISKIDSLYEMTKEQRDSILRGLKINK